MNRAIVLENSMKKFESKIRKKKFFYHKFESSIALCTAQETTFGVEQIDRKIFRACIPRKHPSPSTRPINHNCASTVEKKKSIFRPGLKKNRTDEYIKKKGGRKLKPRAEIRISKLHCAQAFLLRAAAAAAARRSEEERTLIRYGSSRIEEYPGGCHLRDFFSPRRARDFFGTLVLYLRENYKLGRNIGWTRVATVITATRERFFSTLLRAQSF